MSSNRQMQEFVARATDAMLAGDEVETLLRRYNIPYAEAEALLDMVGDLQATFTEVQPSPKFARRLKADLIGGQPATPTTHRRLRAMPFRVQFAAVGAALLGGLTLLWRRRGKATPEATDTDEAPALQQ